MNMDMTVCVFQIKNGQRRGAMSIFLSRQYTRNDLVRRRIRHLCSGIRYPVINRTTGRGRKIIDQSNFSITLGNTVERMQQTGRESWLRKWASNSAERHFVGNKRVHFGPIFEHCRRRGRRSGWKRKTSSLRFIAETKTVQNSFVQAVGVRRTAKFTADDACNQNARVFCLHTRRIDGRDDRRLD